MSDNNKAFLVGQIQGDGFKFSHKNQEGAFYTATIAVNRNSGVCDYIPVIASKNIVKGLEKKTRKVEVRGRFSSYAPRRRATSPRLKLFLFADSIIPKEPEYRVENNNSVCIRARIHKEPVFRFTSLGKRITDLFISVENEKKFRDYIPCIAWGSLAEYASYLSIGDEIQLEGRINSRVYFKKDSPDSCIGEYKTTYEVSIKKIELLE